MPSPYDILPKAPNGEVILNPISGWTAGPVANTAVLIALHYLERDPQRTESEHIKSFVLTPAMAQELAQVLQHWANHILTQPVPPRSGQS